LTAPFSYYPLAEYFLLRFHSRPHMWREPPSSITIHTSMCPDSAEMTLASSRPQTDPRRHRVLIVAGEASGDLHGADLAAQILARDARCEIFGVAGERMRAAGVRALVNTEDIAGLGVAELTSTIRRTFGAFRALRTILHNDPPDLLILLDFITSCRKCGHGGVDGSANSSGAPTA